MFRDRAIPWALLFVLMFAVYAAVTNAQEPPDNGNQATFSVSPSYVIVSLVLGGEGATTEFTLESQAEADLSISITSEFDWIQPSVQSLDLLTTESAVFSITVLCTDPGSTSGLFAIESKNEPQGTTLIPVQRSCEAPPTEFETLVPFQSAKAAVGFEATTSLVWRVSSIWDGHAPIDFSVSASNDLTIDESQGSVDVNQVASTTIRYMCEQEGTRDFFVLLSIDRTLRTWQVECQQGIAGIYPDPPVVRVVTDAGTEATSLLTLVNDYENDLATDYSLSTNDDWLNILQTSGSMPSPSKDYVPVMVSCDEPGTDIGEITISSDTGVVPETFTFPVIRECSVPPVEVRLLNFNNRSRVGIGQIATTSLDWIIRSSWLPQDGLEYTVEATGMVEIENASGQVTRDQVIRTPIQYSCGDTEEDPIFEITVSVNSTSRSFLWHVSCLDPPLGLIVNRDRINMTLNMAQSVATSLEITFRNIHQSEVELNISGTESFIVPITSSKTIGPLDSETISVTLSCSEPGKFSGAIELHTPSDTTVVQSIPVALLCSAPAFSVVFNQPPSATVAEIPNPASGTFIWSLHSYWPSIEAIDYSLQVAQGASATNTAGSLQPNAGASSHTLEYQCQLPSNEDLSIQLTVGGETHTVIWHVECVEPQSVTRLTLSFFQGPLVASLDFVPRETDWELVDQHALDPNMIAGRDTIVEIEVDHSTSRSEPVQLSLTHPEKTTQEAVSSGPPLQKDSGWVTRSSFFLKGEDVFDSQAWEIEIPAFDADDSRSRLARTFPDYWAVQEAPSMKVRFIPIETDEVPEDPDIETIARETMDYFPFSQLTDELLDSMPAPSDVGTAEELAAYLITLWQEDGADPLTLYHGLFTGSRISPDLCGLSEVGGNVAVSRTDLECTKEKTATHEIGHNLSLRHAPCGVENNGADENYPYADGSIGVEFGYFISDRRRVTSNHDVYDIMSYCTPTFISQYYFSQAARNLLDRRPTETTDVALVASASHPPTIDQDGSKWIFSGTVDLYGNWDVAFIAQISKPTKFSVQIDEMDYVIALYSPGHSTPAGAMPFELRTLSHSSKKLWSVVIDEPAIPTTALRILNLQGETLYEMDTTRAFRALNESNGVVPIH